MSSLQELLHRQRPGRWQIFCAQPCVIVIAGNHELLLDSARDDVSVEQPTRELESTGEISSTLKMRKIYGSPSSSRHGNWAFQYPRNRDVWAGSLPDGIDVLITHGPPLSHLDLLKFGCPYLLQTLWRVRPRLHVFGHIHEGSGTAIRSASAIVDCSSLTHYQS
ncbi:hypothetical protein N7490_003202 [Penicillium lividum]|nr:hypothetical protein N7490_003202 [Penicillium lividum]